MKNLILILFSFSYFNFPLAQDPSSSKFGKITPADFKISAEAIDSGANAVIISDIGSTKFEGNNSGYFTLVFTRFVRVKIINKNGFDIANYKFYLYHNESDYEKLTSIRASTYNLENGTIGETKLDEKSIFDEKESKNYTSKKFTMPALKAGAIYELEYTIKSPFSFLLKPWSFQGEYPRLWSEYTVTIAPPFHYVMKLQGDTSFFINTAKAIYSTFVIREDNKVGQGESISMSGNSIQQRWVKKNVPSLHQEPFITSLDNYNTQVSFQLNYFQWNSENERHDYLTNWSQTSKTLLEDEDFGIALNRDNNWMSDELKIIVSNTTSDEEKTKQIYQYIRENFNSDGSNGIYTHHTLKEVFRSRQGNVAEINLLLTAMLRKAGINADPLILSTRNNGIANTSYPLISEYNYVICVVTLGNKIIPLDASENFNGYNQLPDHCYNGWGHIINQSSTKPINFSADSLREKTITSVLILNDERGMPSGTFKNILGKSGSYKIRKEISETSVKDYLKNLETATSSDLKIENFAIDSLKKYDFPITVRYDFDMNNFKSADIIYFSPMFGDEYKKNPFKSMERHYPVEMTHQTDDTYLLTMDIPEGFQIDEMPKSARVNYNENEGVFEYLIQKGETNIQMRVHLKLNKAFFGSEEYPTLRDFFAFVVKKENEQIVFKKIK